MNDTAVAQVSADVQASFAPIVKALDAARPGLLKTADVVAVRPGFKCPPNSDPVPAIVVAVTRGPRPAQADPLEKQFGVPFTVIEATVEEQVAADRKGPVSFGTPDGSMVSAFEKMLGGSGLIDFAAPKEGTYE